MKREDRRVRFGISACLLGRKVRYDARHKRDRFLVETLGKYVDYVPVCPEVECGMSVPREAMRLEGEPGSPRLMTRETRRDLTPGMMAWIKRRVRDLEKENLSGFIFKSRSPSCGTAMVPIFGRGGRIVGAGAGLFSRLFMKRFPHPPAEEEIRLSDPDVRKGLVRHVQKLNAEFAEGGTAC